MVRRDRYNFSKSVHNLNGGKQKQKQKKGRLLKTDSVIIVFFLGRGGENFYFITRFKIMII